MKSIQVLGQMAAMGLLALLPALWATPSLASLRCLGLVSSQGRTCIQGFQSLPAAGHYHYVTISPSNGRRITGTFYVTGSSPSMTIGIFDDSSLDGSEGCHGQFAIYQRSFNTYSTQWNVQGATLGRSCPDVGRTFTIDNMSPGEVMFRDIP